MRVHNARVMHGRHTCACARIRSRARAHTWRYVLTLCNGRIKDGPTPVKAPHTRRRLTTLFLCPTLACVPRSVLAAARSLSPSLSFYLQLPPHFASIFVSSTRPPATSPTVHSLALLIGKHAPSLSLSLIPRLPPRGILSCLSRTTLPSPPAALFPDPASTRFSFCLPLFL